MRHFWFKKTSVLVSFFQNKIECFSWIISKLTKPNRHGRRQFQCELGGDNPDIYGNMSSLVTILSHFEKWLYHE